MFQKHLWKTDILSKDVETCIFTWNVTLPQVFFKYFASKNQLPGLSISRALVENGLSYYMRVSSFFLHYIQLGMGLSIEMLVFWLGSFHVISK